MLMIAILIGIVLTALGVSAWLWFQLKNGVHFFEEKTAVPIADLKTMQPLVAVEDKSVAYEAEISQLKDTINKLSSESAAAGKRQDDELTNHLRAENAAFKEKLDEAVSDVNPLRDKMLRLEEETMRLKEGVVVSENVQKLIQEAKEEYQRKLEAVYKETEQLRMDNINLQQQLATTEKIEEIKRSADEFAGKVRELEIVNALQAEKNEYLQYELVKSRAQVVGVERFCENTGAVSHAR
jgi:t-SNARE complex subunit (syntaxin)